jgi:hypothetical protein
MRERVCVWVSLGVSVNVSSISFQFSNAVRCLPLVFPSLYPLLSAWLSPPQYRYYQDQGAQKYADQDSVPQEIVPNAAYQLTHAYALYGLPVHRTMTVCHLRNGDFLLYNPVRVSPSVVRLARCTPSSGASSTASASSNEEHCSSYVYVIPNAHTRLQDRSVIRLLPLTPGANVW